MFKDLDTRICGNPECQRELVGASEFVLQVTTAHLRWFCRLECATRSQQLADDRIAASFGLVRR